ncbi:MAG: hypothetical protein M1829_003506 [Trizodia sp. TS-e1964]|nr:MAG: hypothetical protein M1829_003506 [Trizodia sp. TS-e1964]
MNYQPLTPESPCLPTILPHVRETIPTLPITPPSVDFDSETESVLSTAVHVLLTEATALSHLSRLYQTEPIARNGFVNAVNCVAASIRNGGKLVIAGVGKSGKVGEKLVATMNSLGILTVFLHPVEALHGDLGSVRQVSDKRQQNGWKSSQLMGYKNDTILLITFSGRTPELCALIPHLPPTVSLIALTAHDSPANSPLTRSRPDSILLPAPIHESEESSFGMSAPTTSTTVAMALGDALAVAIARKIHTVEGRGPREVFKSFHPGGAIGMAPLVQGPPLMLALGTQLSSMPLLPPTTDALSTLDVVMAAVQAPKGWLRFSPDVVLPPRRIKQLRDMTLPIALVPNLGVNKDSWITVPAQSTVEEVLAWVLSVRSDPTKCFLDPGAVFGLVEDGEVNALVEVEQLFE